MVHYQLYLLKKKPFFEVIISKNKNIHPFCQTLHDYQLDLFLVLNNFRYLKKYILTILTFSHKLTNMTKYETKCEYKKKIQVESFLIYL